MLERPLLTTLLCCLSLPGCSGFADRAESPATPPPQNPEASLMALLQGYQGLAGAPGDEQRREYQLAHAAFAVEANDRNRLRLALALTLPAVPERDDHRILGLLESSDNAERAEVSAYQALTILLYRQAQERLRLRNEQRRSERSLQEAQLRQEELQSKLDALRRIDLDLKNRKRPGEGLP